MSKYISTVWRNSLILLVCWLWCGNLAAQTEETKPTQYVALELEKPQRDFFQGFTLSTDLVGPVLWALGDYGSVEAALRLNLKNMYFPIAEIGYGHCDNLDVNTHVHYTTNAPFMRVGCDINFLKNKFQDNRLYVGARYGVSAYQFDIAGPAMNDPVWGGSSPFSVNDINTTSHWIELAFGVQVKIWKNFHMGWSVRYKRELSSSKNNYAQPYYIPGYGTTTSNTTWSGTYHLVFDLNLGKKKPGNLKIITQEQE